MSGIRPPTPIDELRRQAAATVAAALPEAAPARTSPVTPKYKPMRTHANWLDDSEWDAYETSVKRQFSKVHLQRKPAKLEQGAYLYHATDRDLEEKIKTHGLQPRDPNWSKSADASKDGYLSMAVRKSAAGAMGGTSILLRMRIGADIDNWSFRLTGGAETEVRTQLSIPADRLEISYNQGSTWRRLKPPAAAESSSALPLEEKGRDGKDERD
jgi:hypothetical protein